jgi:hypothetical protein
MGIKLFLIVLGSFNNNNNKIIYSNKKLKNLTYYPGPGALLEIKI